MCMFGVGTRTGMVGSCEFYEGHVPVPSRQALRRRLRHGRQGDTVRTSQRRLQAVAHVARQRRRRLRESYRSSDGAVAPPAGAPQAARRLPLPHEWRTLEWRHRCSTIYIYHALFSRRTLLVALTVGQMTGYLSLINMLFLILMIHSMYILVKKK